MATAGQCRLFARDLRSLESSHFKAVRQLEADIRIAPMCSACGEKNENSPLDCIASIHHQHSWQASECRWPRDISPEGPCGYRSLLFRSAASERRQLRKQATNGYRNMPRSYVPTRREFSILLSGAFAASATAAVSKPRSAEAARLRRYAEATHPRGWIAAADPAWRSDWDRLAAEADALTPEAYLMGLMARLAWFHDGHTTMYVDGRVGPAGMIKAPGFDLTLPIVATPFFDGLYVTAAKREGTPLLGARIARVDGVAIEEVLRSFAAMWPGNNPTRAHHDADLILRPAVLRGARLAAPADVSAPVTVEAEIGGSLVKAVLIPRPDAREALQNMSTWWIPISPRPDAREVLGCIDIQDSQAG